MTRIAVLGASGFVGSAVVDGARRSGHEVLALRAPRLNASSNTDEVVRALALDLGRAEVVVNCAGDPNASAAHLGDIEMANSVLPGIVGAATRAAGAARYVHVSSAVVQGRRPMLDSTEAVDGFSPYALSKIAGEKAALSSGPSSTTVYRPPSVHASTRRVTRQLSAIARSPLSSVVAPGNRATPQTHIDDVANAIVFLCTSATPPPRIVHHPWQGHTTGRLLELLSDNRAPRLVPRQAGRAILAGAAAAGRLSSRIAPYARRLEMVWMGQAQGPSWLSEQGWQPVTTEKDWVHLGRQVSGQSNATTPKDAP